jgi:pyruvate/2-oxoglutarate dehydrogenase complex dihydrolipoamide acyltransferase (E2) component
MSILHEIIAPKEDADDEQVVGQLYFESGDSVSMDDDLIDLETSKASITVDSQANGFVEYLVKTGSSVKVGEVIIRIHDQLDSISTGAPPIDKEISESDFTGKKIISRKAAEFISKHNLDISQIKKTFIRLIDVNGGNSSQPTEVRENVSVERERVNNSMLASLEGNLDVREVPLKLAKQVEVAALSSVQSAGLVSTIFYNVDDCTLPPSENLIINTAGSFLPLISYEAARLLVKYPMLNAYYHDKKIMEYLDVNVGVALDMDDGLKVYTLKNTDKLSLEDIELEISQGIYDYFRKALTLNQIKGSTFTITDLSSLGVDRFVPLINYKQSAILGVSGVDKKLNRFTLSLSFDHRVTEGKVASKFLSELSSKLIEHCNNLNPEE